MMSQRNAGYAPLHDEQSDAESQGATRLQGMLLQMRTEMGAQQAQLCEQLAAMQVSRVERSIIVALVWCDQT